MAQALPRLALPCLALFAGALLVAAVSAAFVSQADAAGTQPLSVAVLEFDELDSPQRPTGLGRVVAEEFMFAIQASPDLNLISMDRVFEAQARLRVESGGRCRAARKIGLESGADAVLCGSVTREPGRVRIDAFLIDTDTGRTLWSKSDVSQMDQAGFVNAAQRYVADLSTALAPPEVAVVEPEVVEPEPEVVEPEPEVVEPEVVEPEPEPEQEVIGQGNDQGTDQGADQGAGQQDNATAQDLALAEPDAGYASESFPQDLDDQRRQEQERMDRERALLEFEIPTLEDLAQPDTAGPPAQADSRLVIARSAHASRVEAMLADLEQRIKDRLASMERGNATAEAAYAATEERLNRLLESERERLYGLLRESYREVAQQFAADNGYGAVIEPAAAEQEQGDVPDVSSQLLDALDQAQVPLPEPPSLDVLPEPESGDSPAPGQGDTRVMRGHAAMPQCARLWVGAG